MDKLGVRLCVLLNFLAISNTMTVNRPGSFRFHRNTTGVVFSPYVKRWEWDADGKGTIADFKNYTMVDVRVMLNLISTKFRHITTWSVGAGRPNESWHDGDAAGLVATTAANINAQNQKTIFTAVIGVWHSHTPQLFQKEAENALTVARIANSVHPNTVWGLALSSFSWMNFAYHRDWGHSIPFLREYRSSANAIGLKIGVRLDACEQIISRVRPVVGIENLSPSLPGDIPKIGQGGHPDIQMIAQLSDFVICIMLPTPNMVSNGTQAAVNSLGKEMKLLEMAFKAFNQNITVRWETGWPSSGVSRFGSKNTVRNLQNYWKQMDAWASSTNTFVYMYSAFDEPWKTNPNSTKDITDPEGPDGADSRFGWWYLKYNRNMMSFMEKEAEPEVVPPVTLSPFAVAGIVVGVLVPIILILGYRLYKARQTIDKLTAEDINEFFNGNEGKRSKNRDDSLENALNMPYDRSFELSPDSFVIDELEELGSGEFGTVYKGRIQGIEGNVAFKKPKKNISASQLKNLLAEIKIMVHIGKHENVVVLLGAHTEKIREGIVYIASECCEMGSLETHLRSIPRTFVCMNEEMEQVELRNDELEAVYVNHAANPKDTKSTSRKVAIPSMIRWSYEIANGMEYLTSRKIVHADLATRNVLLTADGTAKISDFGLSRRLYEYTQYVKSSQEPLPWRWMAIESLRHLTFSSKSDVWSYGITIWEIFSLGDLPYPGLSWDVEFLDKLDQGLRMSMPKYATVDIYEAMLKCWHNLPEVRPSFTELRMYFGEKLQQ